MSFPAESVLKEMSAVLSVVLPVPTLSRVVTPLHQFTTLNFAPHWPRSEERPSLFPSLSARRFLRFSALRF